MDKKNNNPNNKLDKNKKKNYAELANNLKANLKRRKVVGKDNNASKEN